MHKSPMRLLIFGAAALRSFFVYRLVQIRYPVWPVAMALALLALPAGATSICRWVDENGRTQLAEVVPDKYRLSDGMWRDQGRSVRRMQCRRQPRAQMRTAK